MILFFWMPVLKSYQNDEHVEYISERIQEAQSQLVELADDEPIGMALKFKIFKGGKG